MGTYTGSIGTSAGPAMATPNLEWAHPSLTPYGLQLALHYKTSSYTPAQINLLKLLGPTMKSKHTIPTTNAGLSTLVVGSVCDAHKIMYYIRVI